MDIKYKELLEAIINKQSNVLGVKVAVRRARNIIGLQINEEGKVLSCNITSDEALEKLVQEYTSLSGEIGKNFCLSAINAILKKYPDINIPKNLNK